jgi:glycosyltransferase involved in cell wall biosynthesis
MPRPCVTIVSPTLTGNALFRTDVIVRLLRDDFDVQVVAVDGSSGLYEPLADVPEFQQAQRVNVSSMLDVKALGRKLDTCITGAAVICVKPLMRSFGATLLALRHMRRPLILDIDDWEVGFISRSPYWEARQWGHRWLSAINSPLYTRLLDGLTYKASAITVSNTFLQGLYGGHWIPHTRDHATARHPSRSVPTVMFAGSPRGHKGLPTLLDAWSRIRHRNAELHLVVPDPADAQLAAARQERGSGVRVYGPVRFGELAGLLAQVDVVVVPQDNTPGSVGQLPAKLIEAMAGGLPIVATDVCDAIRWLGGGAGLVVPPGSPSTMTEAIDYMLDHPDQAASMGERARERFLRFGSTAAVRPRFVRLVLDLIEGRTIEKPSPAFAT